MLHSPVLLKLMLENMYILYSLYLFRKKICLKTVNAPRLNQSLRSIILQADICNQIYKIQNTQHVQLFDYVVDEVLTKGCFSAIP